MEVTKNKIIKKLFVASKFSIQNTEMKFKLIEIALHGIDICLLLN